MNFLSNAIANKLKVGCEREFNDLEQSIPLESVEIELPIAEIYRGVVFG